MRCHCNANVAGVHNVQVSYCVLVAKVDCCKEVATLKCPDVLLGESTQQCYRAAIAVIATAVL